MAMRDCEYKDEILRTAIQVGRPVSLKLLYNKFEQKLEAEQLSNYLLQIKDHPNEIAKVNPNIGSMMILKNHNTEVFLNEGGFCALEAKSKREKEHEQYNFKYAKYVYKSRWLPHIISIIALGVAILAYFKDPSS